ncbi:hypothetical protein HMPREF0663_10157 [Hoylesella oralis ATCC 33269]|uniref:Uncharacterized protein n=1 Tax=Hoylesella oralis ATCC 33269 TaxID=873533 RepID=E7RM07_9BACT|nr:hypothetical protein HMPREF0663_10157 [Hoylesella oralis ATCC 33269]
MNLWRFRKFFIVFLLLLNLAEVVETAVLSVCSEANIQQFRNL